MCTCTAQDHRAVKEKQSHLTEKLSTALEQLGEEYEESKANAAEALSQLRDSHEQELASVAEAVKATLTKKDAQLQEVKAALSHARADKVQMEKDLFDINADIARSDTPPLPPRTSAYSDTRTRR